MLLSSHRLGQVLTEWSSTTASKHQGKQEHSRGIAPGVYSCSENHVNDKRPPPDLYCRLSSSAPTKVCALPGSASRRSRCSANDLSWRLESTRHTAPVRTGKNTNASLLRSKMTLKLSGMENLRQIEQDVLLCDSSPGMTARDVEADIAREAREAKRKQETERINRTLAEKSRFIVHVPPSSKFSKFKVLGPDLYEK